MSQTHQKSSLEKNSKKIDHRWSGSQHARPEIMLKIGFIWVEVWSSKSPQKVFKSQTLVQAIQKVNLEKIDFSMF
jgi:hypothetical protein